MSRTNAAAEVGLTILGRQSLRATVRHVFGWAGHESLLGIDIAIRVALTVFAVRFISRLVHDGLMPESTWKQSDELAKTFTPDRKAAESEDVGNAPRLILEHDGYRFYRHAAVYQGQPMGPCPLRRCDPCMSCEFFLRGNDGRPYCAAMAKVKTAYHEGLKDKSIWEIRDILKDTYGGRVGSQATDNGGATCP